MLFARHLYFHNFIESRMWGVLNKITTATKHLVSKLFFFLKSDVEEKQQQQQNEVKPENTVN